MAGFSSLKAGTSSYDVSKVLFKDVVASTKCVTELSDADVDADFGADVDCEDETETEETDESKFKADAELRKILVSIVHPTGLGTTIRGMDVKLRP